MKRNSVITTSLLASSLILFAATSPASAHNDELVTNPAAKSSVEAGEIPVSLEFGEPIMVSDNVINDVIVTNEHSLAVPYASCTKVDGNKLSATVMIDQPGTYQVAYRTVSEDGHPVEGNYTFEVKNTTDYKVDEGKQAVCAEAMPMSGEPRVISAPAPQTDNTPTYFAIGALVLFALGAFSVIRRNRKRIK